MGLKFTNIADYLPELNTNSFIAGCDASIYKTREKGDETEFEVSYHPSFGFIYPKKIRVGNNMSVSPKLIEKKRRHNSHLLTNYSKQPWFKRVILKDLIKDLTREDDIEIDYPTVIGYKTLHKPSLEDNYILKLIGFHTHPKGDDSCLDVSPSSDDLRTLNNYRKKGYGLGYNSIEVILGVDEYQVQRACPYLIIQENIKNPNRPINFDFFSSVIGEWVSESGLAEGITSKHCNIPYNMKQGWYVIGEGFKEANHRF